MAHGSVSKQLFDLIVESMILVSDGRQSADKLRKTEKVTEDNVVVADVTDPPSLKNAFEGVDQVILCTSAVPKVRIAFDVFLSERFTTYN